MIEERFNSTKLNTPSHATDISHRSKRSGEKLVQNSFHDLVVNRPLPRRFEQNRSRSGVHHPENGAGGRRDKGGIGEREERWDDRRPAKTNERWVARYRIIFVDSCGKLAK